MALKIPIALKGLDYYGFSHIFYLFTNKMVSNEPINKKKIQFLIIPFTYTNINYMSREKVFYRSVGSGSVLVRLKKQCCLPLDDYWAGCRHLQWQAAAQGYGCLPAKWHRGHTTRKSSNARERKRKPSGKSVTDLCHVLCMLTLLYPILFPSPVSILIYTDVYPWNFTLSDQWELM